MAFELFIPNYSKTSIKPGECSVNVSSSMSLCLADLHRIGIDGHAAIMVDRDTSRIALRKATDKKTASKFQLNKTRTVGKISIRAALTSMNIEHGRVKGRWPIVQKDNLLIVQF